MIKEARFRRNSDSTYGDTDTVGSKVTKTQNTRTVGNDDNLDLTGAESNFFELAWVFLMIEGYEGSYVIDWPVVDHGGHLTFIRGAEVHAASAAVEETVLLASETDSGGIDDGCWRDREKKSAKSLVSRDIGIFELGATAVECQRSRQQNLDDTHRRLGGFEPRTCRRESHFCLASWTRKGTSPKDQ